MPDILPRRRMLRASAAALPLLLGTAGCRSADVFAGPDPLASPPRPAPDVITLQAVIAAEETLIQLYKTAIGTHPGTTALARRLNPLLAQHQEHLAQLQARLILPAGRGGLGGRGGPGGTVSPPARGGAGAASPRANPAPGRVTTARLRTAERASAAGLVERLATVEPALAQLFASIAASDATHARALGG